MSYIINWKNPLLPGKSPITVPVATAVANAASLTFTGKGSSNYGVVQQENLLRLLDNFADATAPAYPTLGQLWYDSTNSVLNICNSLAPINWASLAGVQVTTGIPPILPKLGDLWFDRTGPLSGTLYAYTGLGQFPPAVWNPYTEGAFPAISPLTAPWCGVKLNYSNFTGVNYSELYIHGFTGSTAADVDGTILLNGVSTTMPRGQIATGMPGQAFIMWNTATMPVADYKVVRHVGLGQWEYDNNAQWVSFVPTATEWIVGVVTVAEHDDQNAPGIAAATIWQAGKQLSLFRPCDITNATGALGGWAQVWPAVEHHGARYEYDAMLERVLALVGSPVSFGGNEAARALSLPDLNTRDACLWARLNARPDANVAPVGLDSQVAVEPTSYDWDRLLAAARWAVSRLDLPSGMADDVSASPFTQDGQAIDPLIASLPVSDVRRPPLVEFTNRRVGSISSTRLFAETMNVLAVANNLRYSLRGIAGPQSTVTTLADNVASYTFGQAATLYGGGAGTTLYATLYFPGMDDIQRFINGGSALDVKLDYAYTGAGAVDVAFKAFLDNYNTYRVTADKVRIFNNAGVLAGPPPAGGLNSAMTGSFVILGGATLSGSTVSIAAAITATGITDQALIQLRATITGAAGLTGTLTATVNVLRDTTTFTGDEPLFVRPNVNATPFAGSTGWTQQGVTAAPVANFTCAVTTGAAPFSATLVYAGTGAPTSIEWAFNDTMTYTATGNSTIATFTQRGTYAVRCRATNAGGQDILTRPTYITVT